MAVLYRKYRPQTFAQVVGQKHIIRTLENQVALGHAAHAYLFTGSRGVGKTSVARIVAKAINCPNSKGGDACGVCNVCKQIEAGNFMDLVEIDAASNTGVDNIRELIEHVKFSPAVGKYKVFIIDEVHMLSKGAFNALLKTLEEPPRHAVFILATTEINKVPVTIISRTQRFDFKALPAAEIFGQLQKICALEKISLNPEILDLVAQNSDGSLRDALSLLDKVMTLGSDPSAADCQQLLGITDIAVCEQLLELTANSGAGALPEFFDTLSAKGLDFTILNRDFLEYLRKALVYKITEGRESFSLSEDHLKTLARLTENFSSQDLIFIIRLFLRSCKDLDTSPSPQIPLLLAALEGAFRKPANQMIDKSNDRQTGKPDAAQAPGVSVKTSVKDTEPEKTAVAITESIYAPKPAAADAGLPEAPPIAEAPAADEAVMTLAEVETFWPRVIAKIKQINGPLANLLKSCSLIEVMGGKVYVGVKFLFNKQHLENPKNTQVILQAFEEVTGKKMSVSARVLTQENAQPSVSAALTDALQIFGGELVE